MKKLYSTMMMLAMMVAALSFTACGGDDDEVDNGGGSNTALTITVDGQEHNRRSFPCLRVSYILSQEHKSFVVF